MSVKALAATLSDTEPKEDFDNEDDGILNAFTATVNPTDGIVEDVDEEEELVESKFEKMDDQDDIRTAYEKLYKVSEKHEKHEELSTKCGEAKKAKKAIILGAPPKLDKKEAKNPKAKKANSQKPKQKKQYLCHHCGAASHTRPNCYK